MSIDTGVRRQVFSTAILQKQIIECCCQPKPEVHKPATVIRISPPNGAQFRIVEKQGGDSPSEIVIVFDKELDPATVTNDSIRVTFVEGNGAPGTQPGQVDYRAGTATAVFRTQNGGPFSAGPFNSRTYTVTVRGEAPNAIEDVDHLALDGDKDGNAGGNFTSQFTVVFIVG